jgi:hypothetical protein
MGMILESKCYKFLEGKAPSVAEIVGEWVWPWRASVRVSEKLVVVLLLEEEVALLFLLLGGGGERGAVVPLSYTFAFHHGIRCPQVSYTFSSPPTRELSLLSLFSQFVGFNSRTWISFVLPKMSLIQAHGLLWGLGLIVALQCVLELNLR